MKKSLLFVLVFGSLWGAKLSYDLFQLQAKHQGLQTQLQKVETRNTNLNDQLVALQRQTQQTQQSQTATSSNNMTAEVERNETFWLTRQIELVEFSLQQHQYDRSLELLIQLDRDLDHYGLSPALQQSLHQVILQDQQQIQNFAQTRHSQQQQIAQLLQQVNALLQQAILQEPKLNTTPQEEQSFLQSWFKLEKIQNLQPQLLQRPLILKEAQLRLIVAQQLFLQGQYIHYQQELTFIQTLFDLIPEAQSNNIQKELYKVQSIEALAIPKLSTRALIGNQ